MSVRPCQSAASVGSAEAERARPFHFFEVADFEPIGMCDDVVPMLGISGVGHGSHLGRVEISGESLDDLLPEAFATGPIVDGVGPIELHADVVTGTGRFANVDLGTEPLTGTVTFYDEFGVSGRIEAGIDGWITYDPSDVAH